MTRLMLHKKKRNFFDESDAHELRCLLLRILDGSAFASIFGFNQILVVRASMSIFCSTFISTNEYVQHY
ncbi:unnamed protein product [Adineta ricciae]|uniref:Uncharacterized protein n=1 Tax=Adineta ricciae TaxID=249248 RepID=A0A815Q2E9_ADIRI|nr:unnamed protein product [Adineta ricciae]